MVGMEIFDNNPDRAGRNSLKWGKFEGKDILPLWVADMDFRSPPEVIRVATEVAEFGNYGYGTLPGYSSRVSMSAFKVPLWLGP